MPTKASRTQRPFERGEEWGPTNATAPETKGRQCFWGTSHTSVQTQRVRRRLVRCRLLAGQCRAGCAKHHAN